MPDSKIHKLLRKNLLYTIRTAEGSELFRHIYVKDEQGREFDALNDGELSCAYVVSAILAVYGLIDRAHATVETTLREMQTAGWLPAKDATPGAVVYWPAGADGHTRRFLP